MEALPREDDPYRSYCEEPELRDEDEWPEESYLLTAPGAPRPEDFARPGRASPRSSASRRNIRMPEAGRKVHTLLAVP
jgi:hypothetical protein